ncbi:hypothetical protein CVM52_19300 [Pseudooceanicola lipolyticus]|uniref:Ancillary SecYEG translocon subunit/Cell division coordinator CpoB TPR domain-containing protein n=1 Tax=Pseudooceanicola lipolyticus TaxID=2029104 RepID=A0A2M8IX06_9RHOB|nr:tetratricopeptide repeat protein [Pseudooceanicola lipolyticus]PJE35018.1 hypothetical protein CVM52_19300 [Pseudooceanicola lipolyticus]
MSNSDSFIDEVTEEVRKDRLFQLFRRYGWIAGVVIVLIVGGAAWNEYRKARDRAAAEALGDQILAAMNAPDASARAEQLSDVTAQTPGGGAIVEFVRAGAQAEAGEVEAAVAGLNRIATDGDLPLIYRQIASFKALALQSDTLSADERRSGFEALAQPGVALRLLAEEQLALIELEQGETEAAIDRFQSILADAESTSDLQQRATQAIVALGGTPELSPRQQG